jgi:hypothetical protein
MATLSPAQIYTLALNAGLSSTTAAVATAVALAESGGRTDAQGDVGLQNATWGPSVGLWQIRSLKAEYGKGTPRDASMLTNPDFNARAMASISNGGKNFKPWTTYTSGAYKKQIDKIGVSGIAGGLLGTMPGGDLVDIVTGGAVGAASGAADAANGLLTGWAGDAMKIGLYIVGAGACVALVVVGAVHTVSDK